VLVTGLLALLLYFAFIEVNYIRVLFLAVFVALVVGNLFYYVTASNRETVHFLNAIINNDFTNKYTDYNKGPSFTGMYQAFNRVNEQLRTKTMEAEGQFQYISTLIEQLNVGVVSFDKRGNIQLMNQPFKNILQVTQLSRLEGIQPISPPLYHALTTIQAGNQALVNATVHGHKYRLTVVASAFVLHGKQYKLVSIQDIKGALDQEEMAAWQKLISVLTHEIMNSVAPIASLSATLLHIAQGHLQQGAPPPTMGKLAEGLAAIKGSSSHLMTFTKDYRSLTRIPQPNVATNDSHQFMASLLPLFKATLQGTAIALQEALPRQPFVFMADPGLLQQALLNLFRNAKEAITANGATQGLINISMVQPQGGGIQFTVTDNGGGIAHAVAEQMFVPFYTNKQGGSGVGLSVVKQIVQLHSGTIDYATANGKTTFTISIPAQ